MSLFPSGRDSADKFYLIFIELNGAEHADITEKQKQQVLRRVYYTPNLKLSRFVCYDLKMINTFVFQIYRKHVNLTQVNRSRNKKKKKKMH